MSNLQTMQAIQPIITLYEKSRIAEDTWQQDHKDAMECRNLEDQIELGIGILGLLAQLTSNLRADENAWRRELVVQATELYARWISRSEAILSQVAMCEAKNFKVDRADEFRECVAKTKAVPLDVDEVQRRFDNAFLDVTSLDEAFNELHTGG